MIAMNIESARKRPLQRYKRSLNELAQTIQLELAAIDDSIFTSSSGVVSQSLEVAFNNQKLKVLIEDLD